ncbi:MAG: FAD-binding oxidoreductase [Pseudomonadota bacterium]
MTTERAPRCPVENVRAALAELDGLVVDTEPARVQRRSRDFSWFSPILAEGLDGVAADAVVSPADDDELKALLAACWRHDVPVTVRGAGTGTRGEAVPLRGGIVLDMGYFNHVLAIEPGWCRAQAGCVLDVLERALREHGQSLRLHPSTSATATVGGFVSSGEVGVGSITWGGVRSTGAVRALRVVTLEERPRTLELRGPHARLALHGVGTTGVITEVELPTAPLTRWQERVLGFADLGAALRFAEALAHADAVPKRLVSVIGGPAPGRFLFPHGLGEAVHVVLVMVAETATEALDEIVAGHGGEALSVAGSPLYEYAWQHTTLHALKHDRALTWLEVDYPPPDAVQKVIAMAGAMGEALITHVEFVRRNGVVTCHGLPLVRYGSRERLAEIIRAHEAHGCPVDDPHVWTHASQDPLQAAFAREIDPKGLLNPGKLPRG